MSIKKLITCAFIGIFIPPSVFGLTANTISPVSNNYVFIENNVDSELFIAPLAQNPRFSGANVWTRYSTNQDSLGYMGLYTFSPYATNRYMDLWLENSPINAPFLGIRCRVRSGATCPASGYISGEVIDRQGFYHTKGGSSEINGNRGEGTFSNSAYQYFREQNVGSSTTMNLNYCVLGSTSADYDVSSGLRCKDLDTSSGARWTSVNFTVNKVGHLRLKGSNALAEIWIASDGTPSVNYGSEFCQVGVSGSLSGLVCKMISYDYTQTASNNMRFAMVINTTALNGYSPSNNMIKYSKDGSSWNNNNVRTNVRDMFTNGGGDIYIFMSNTFFKQIIDRGIDIANAKDLFTFAFDNSGVNPQSGYYQFTPSTDLKILPREYGVSIRSADGISAPKGSGKIGDMDPITFNYVVTTSAYRQADSITAQVTGTGTTIGGKAYCLFSSPDGTLQVPIPAYLSWTTSTGSSVSARNSCIEGPVDITKALWTQTAWNANLNDGYFFSTNLSLTFPMTDARSQYSNDGVDWHGVVNATGEVKITAKWVGVDAN